VGNVAKTALGLWRHTEEWEGEGRRPRGETRDEFEYMGLNISREDGRFFEDPG
jgi:hypothetical protein